MADTRFTKLNERKANKEEKAMIYNQFSGLKSE